MRNKILGGVGAAVVALVTVFTGLAGATPPDPDTEVTSYLTTAFGQLTPVIVAVAVGSLGILVLSIGFGMARRAVTSRGRAGT